MAAECAPLRNVAHLPSPKRMMGTKAGFGGKAGRWRGVVWICGFQIHANEKTAPGRTVSL